MCVYVCVCFADAITPVQDLVNRLYRCAIYQNEGRVRRWHQNVNWLVKSHCSTISGFFLHDWLFTLKLWTHRIERKWRVDVFLFCFLLWINLLGALGQKLIGGPFLIPIFVPLSVQYLYCSSAHQMQLTLETTCGSLIIFCLKSKKLTSTPVLEYYLPAGKLCVH